MEEQEAKWASEGMTDGTDDCPRTVKKLFWCLIILVASLTAQFVGTSFENGGTVGLAEGGKAEDDHDRLEDGRGPEHPAPVSAGSYDAADDGTDGHGCKRNGQVDA